MNNINKNIKLIVLILLVLLTVSNECHAKPSNSIIVVGVVLIVGASVLAAALVTGIVILIIKAINPDEGPRPGYEYGLKYDTINNYELFYKGENYENIVQYKNMNNTISLNIQSKKEQLVLFNVNYKY